MRTPKIASVLALCGAANLALAADIPGVLGDPGTTTETAEASERSYFGLRVTSEKAWVTRLIVTLDHVENRHLSEELRCFAITPSANLQTFERDVAERAKVLDTMFTDSIAELSIGYTRSDPDKAGVVIWSHEPLNPNATSQIDIGNLTLQLTNFDRHRATFTSRKNRIDLIEAIMRGRTATFSSHGPNGFIQRTFSLAGATAMAELAARVCRADNANPGKSESTPTASRKTTSQPSQQARTTTQQRQHQTQTATHQPREEDPLDDLAGHIANQGLQMVADEFINEMFGDFGF